MAAAHHIGHDGEEVNATMDRRTPDRTDHEQGMDAPVLRCVLGGGGPFGIAWMLGVLHEMHDHDVPVLHAPTIGTSAGTWVAGALRLDIDIDRFAALDNPVRPTSNPDTLRDLAHTLFGDTHVDDVAAVAVPFPGLRRTVLNGDRFLLADQVAASSALPGLVPPFRHGPRRFVDGGVVSSTSVDLADAAQHLLVLAPMAGGSLTGAGRFVAAQLHHETVKWKQRHHGTMTVVRPDRAAARLAGLPHRFFDTTRMLDVYKAGRAQGFRTCEHWDGPHGRL